MIPPPPCVTFGNGLGRCPRRQERWRKMNDFEIDQAIIEEAEQEAAALAEWEDAGEWWQLLMAGD